MAESRPLRRPVVRKFLRVFEACQSLRFNAGTTLQNWIGQFENSLLVEKSLSPIHQWPTTRLAV